MKDILIMILPVASVLITLICTIITNALREKRVFRYRLQSEVFFMKIKLYEEILIAIAKAVDDEFFCGAVFIEDDNEKFNAIINDFIEFKSRAYLVGSEDVIQGIQGVFNAVTSSEVVENPMERFIRILIALEQLRKIIRIEIQPDIKDSNVNSVSNEIEDRIQDKGYKKKYQPKEDNR